MDEFKGETLEKIFQDNPGLDIDEYSKFIPNLKLDIKRTENVGEGVFRTICELNEKFHTKRIIQAYGGGDEVTREPIWSVDDRFVAAWFNQVLENRFQEMVMLKPTPQQAIILPYKFSSHFAGNWVIKKSKRNPDWVILDDLEVEPFTNEESEKYKERLTGFHETMTQKGTLFLNSALVNTAVFTLQEAWWIAKAYFGEESWMSLDSYVDEKWKRFKRLLEKEDFTSKERLAEALLRLSFENEHVNISIPIKPTNQIQDLDDVQRRRKEAIDEMFKQASRPTKCDTCVHKKWYSGSRQPDDLPHGYCSKMHWENHPVSESDPNLEYNAVWDGCGDFEAKKECCEKPENFDIQKVIETLQGTSLTLNEAIEMLYGEGFTDMCLESSDYDVMNNEIFLCDQCGWWCEISERADVEETDGADMCQDCCDE